MGNTVQRSRYRAIRVMGNTVQRLRYRAIRKTKETKDEEWDDIRTESQYVRIETSESDRAISTPSSDYLWEQVFLSHSVKQRDFVEQLYIDLTRANVSCFFDRYSFPDGQGFNPSRSFEVPETCEVAIVVLSEDYITSELSMLQLCAFVEAEKAANSKLKIYPLFYGMSPDEFSHKIDKFEEKGFPKSWSNFAEFSESSIDYIAWLEALKALRSFEEPLSVQNDGTVAYRHKLLCDVHGLLSPNTKGKERLSQVVADLFEKAPYYKNGVKVIGFYGIHGSGKTTLCKSLCGFYSNDFQGKVFHAEFHKEGLPIETLKGLLQILTDANEESMKLVENYEQALSLLKQQMSSQRVFLCLDNIPDRLKSVKEAQAYLTAGFGEGSLVVLTAQSVEILERVIPEKEKSSFVRVPNLSEEEAIDVFLNLTEVKAHNLTSEEKHIAAEYADVCRFGRGMSSKQGGYHPLALTVLGAHLYEKSACDPSQWLRNPDFNEYASRHKAQEIIFYIFEQTFNFVHPQCLRMLLFLIFFVPNFDFVQSFHHFAFQWLADVCSHESNESVRDIIYRMKIRGLIEIRGRNSISFHDLLVGFGKSKLEGMKKWLLLEGKDEVRNANPSIVEALKLKNYTSSRIIPFDEFSNVSVVHLESVWNLVTLNFESMKAVRSIAIVECDALEEIQGLSSLSKLCFLKVEGCESLKKCPEIGDLKELRHLQLRLCGVEDADHRLYLRSATRLSLEEIHLDGVRGVGFFRRLCRIRAVSINNDYGIERLDFTDCLKLQWIKLRNCKSLIELNLTSCINVRSIYLCKILGLIEIEGLDELIALEELHLMEMEMLSVNRLLSFQKLGNLRHLTLRDMKIWGELPDLSNCHRLTKVDIDIYTHRGNRVIIRDVSELKEMQDQSDRIHVY